MHLDTTTVLSKSRNSRAIGLHDEVQRCKTKVVYKGNSDRRLELFGPACNPTDALDEIVRSLLEQQFGLNGYAAFEFLSELFYRTTYYPVIAKATFWSALKEEYSVDPYKPVIDLYKVSAQAGYNRKRNELFVFVWE